MKPEGHRGTVAIIGSLLIIAAAPVGAAFVARRRTETLRERNDVGALPEVHGSSGENPWAWAGSDMSVPGWGFRAEPVVPRRRLEGSVRIRPVQVMGLVSPEAVRRVALRHLEGFEHCYAAGLAGDPALAGRVELRVVVDRDAAIVYGRVGASTLADASVASCMAAIPRRWSGLARFIEGQFVEVLLSLVLSPPNSTDAGGATQGAAGTRTL